MPFINVKTNKSIPAEQSLKAKLGQAITAIPGKSEGWLMLAFEPEVKMYFKGSDEGCAMVQISIYGSCSAAAKQDMTGRVTDILAEELGLRPDRIYVSYAETADWGWNGSNF